MERIETLGFDEIRADAELMSIVRSTGHQLFGDNCAACHGVDGRGRTNYPDLTDDDWLWGDSVEAIAETMRVGINTRSEEHTSELQSLMRNSYAVFCLKKKKQHTTKRIIEY